MSANQSSDHVAERAADRNRRAKDRHDTTSCLDRKKIGQNRRCRRPVATFANSDAYASYKENCKCRRKAGAAAGQAPQNHSGTNNDPPRESIGEQTENRRAEHISYEKGVAQQTSFRHSIYVACCEKVCTNIRLKCRQNLAVDVIKKIDGQEQKKCATCAAHRFFHDRLHRNCRLQFARCRL